MYSVKDAEEMRGYCLSVADDIGVLLLKVTPEDPPVVGESYRTAARLCAEAASNMNRIMDHFAPTGAGGPQKK